jgi:hypothetical protein
MFFNVRNLFFFTCILPQRTNFFRYAKRKKEGKKRISERGVSGHTKTDGERGRGKKEKH